MESEPVGCDTEFREAAKELRNIITPETTNDIDALRGHVERLKIALEKRAGANQYQQSLVRTAVSEVVRYFDHGRPRNEREELLHTLFRLERAAGVEQEPPTEEQIRLDTVP